MLKRSAQLYCRLSPTSISMSDRGYKPWTPNASLADRRVDLRSDTVTRPSEGMRAAMAQAIVGDDVMKEDPTVNKLEERCAALLGQEAALFTPSTSMSNLIAIMIHCEAWASELIVGRLQHIAKFERGTYAHIARASANIVDNAADGTIALADIARCLRNADDIHQPTTRLVCLENTHNVGGGLILPDGYVESVRRLLDDKAPACAIHLDGARLYNAAVGSGRSLASLCEHVTSVAMCLSKGVGAPVGSVLGGDRAFIARARGLRKALGGGMRQVGILAEAALFALDRVDEVMAIDHVHARRLADGINAMGVGLACAIPPTNIVMVETGETDAEALSARWNAAGVLCFSLTSTTIRLVTHLDVSTPAIDHALSVIAEHARLAPTRA